MTVDGPCTNHGKTSTGDNRHGTTYNCRGTTKFVVDHPAQKKERRFDQRFTSANLVVSQLCDFVGSPIIGFLVSFVCCWQ